MEQKPVKPIIKDGNILLFPGGFSRKMTLLERWKWRRGTLKEIKLSSGKPTKFL